MVSDLRRLTGNILENIPLEEACFFGAVEKLRGQTVGAAKEPLSSLTRIGLALWQGLSSLYSGSWPPSSSICRNSPLMNLSSHTTPDDPCLLNENDDRCKVAMPNCFCFTFSLALCWYIWLSFYRFCDARIWWYLGTYLYETWKKESWIEKNWRERVEEMASKWDCCFVL